MEDRGRQQGARRRGRGRADRRREPGRGPGRRARGAGRVRQPPAVLLRARLAGGRGAAHVRADPAPARGRPSHPGGPGRRPSRAETARARQPRPRERRGSRRGGRAPRCGVTADAASVREGGTVGFAISVRNLGRITARRLEVCVRPSGALEITRAPGPASARAARCWTLASLPPGVGHRYRATARAIAQSAVGGHHRDPARANVTRATARAGVSLLRGRPARPSAG